MSKKGAVSQKKRVQRDDADNAPRGGPHKTGKSEHLSVAQILTHDVTQLALVNWAAGAESAPFTMELVTKIYADCIVKGDLSQLVMLETTKYLER
jgi:hypothetical protein